MSIFSNAIVDTVIQGAAWIVLLTLALYSSYPSNGSQKLIEIEDERKLRVFMEKRVR